jgi:hypothetical protein
MAHITRMAITILNPIDDDYQQMRDICQIARYAVAADETCPTTGTPHIQAYVALKQEKKQRQSGWKKLLPRAHLVFNARTELYASNYCKKGEQPKAQWDELEEKGPDWGKNVRMIFEYGVLDHRGLDGRMVTLAHAMVSGTVDLRGIKKEYPESFVMYHRGYEKLQEEANKKIFRTWQTTSEWIHGYTGTGKSHRWKSIWDPNTMFRMKSNDKGWSDGYDGQPIIIIDELRKGHIPYSDLLQMLDSGPYDLPNRGKAPTPFLARHVFITSCYHPRDLYNDLDGDDSIDQLIDRLGVITHMTGQSKRKVSEIIFLEQVQERYGVCEAQGSSKETSGQEN